METVFTLGLMAFLAIMLVLSFGIPAESIQGDMIGARGFPIAMIAIGLLLCALILVRQARQKKHAEEKLIDFASPGGKAAVAAVLALIVYLLAMNTLGYILSTLLFSAVTAWLTGFRKPVALALFTFVLTAVLFLLFGKLFFVPLPRGVGFLRELSYLLY